MHFALPTRVSILLCRSLLAAVVALGLLAFSSLGSTYTNAAGPADSGASGILVTGWANGNIQGTVLDCTIPLTINDNGDAGDITPGDGLCVTGGAVCTLRAAIEEANALNACGTIDINFSLSTPTTINLATALPSIAHNINLNGPGASLLTVRRSSASSFRIFSTTASLVVNISGITIAGGLAAPSEDGGGILNQSNTTLTLTNIKVSGNATSDATLFPAGFGGGIFNRGTVNLINSTVSGNVTGRGFSGGPDDGGDGGGIYNSTGALNVTNSTISANATGNGIGPNGVDGKGGGVYGATGMLTLTNSTVSGNTTSTGDSITFGGQGAGIFRQNSTVSLTNCTVVNNIASLGFGGSSGGGISGFAFVRNTIIANNNATNGPDVSLSHISQGNNLIGRSDGSNGFTNGSNGDQVGTLAAPIDPLLTPLQDNGGPTLTHALFANSPAVDKGNNCVVFLLGIGGCLGTPLTTDQRGFLRQVDGDGVGGAVVDIGAYELQIAPTVLPTIQFSTTSFSKSESGPSTNITVTRTGDTSSASSVDFRTEGNGYVACNVFNGSAVQNCDFILSSGTLNFASGQASRTFPIIINDDTYVEGSENLGLTLSNPVGATLGTPSTATLTITDNDTAGAPSPGPKTFIAALSSGQEVPPSGTSGKGGGIVQLDTPETATKVGLLFSNLSSPQTDAHIHGPAAVGASGPIVFPLPLGTVIDHNISPTTQQVSDLKAGLHYLNVHSSNFTGGEIRGQLLWNPLNEPVYLVTQHYYDFLGRLPDQGGQDFWVNSLTACGISVQCLRDQTVGVSNAFFYEQEYQQTASYVFLLYRAAYGNTQPFPNPDPNTAEAQKLPRYLTFVRDRAQVVGGTELANSQAALANAFVQRAEFIARYPSSLATGAQFVDAVLATIQSASGVTFAAADRTALINHFDTGGRGRVMFHLANDYWNGCNRLPGSPAAPCVPAGFGAAVDNRVFIDAEYNRSFVYSQYSGYLRRDGDIGGFLFWLNQVSTAPPRNVAKQKAMVCAFITSDEYQFRFGEKAPRNNVECIP